MSQAVSLSVSQGYLLLDRAMASLRTSKSCGDLVCSVMYDGGAVEGQHGHPRSLLWAEVSSNLHCPCLHRFQVHVPALAGLSCTRKCKCWDALSSPAMQGSMVGENLGSAGSAAKPLLGDILVVLAQLLAATQFIVEEKYLAK